MSPAAGRISPAVLAETAYLVNLLLAPGLAFVVLLVLFRRHRDSGDALVRVHVRQAFAASVAAGVLLIGVPALIALTGDLAQPHVWTMLLLYFVSCHGALVLLGVFALARALAGKPYSYPLLGGFR
jgi:hypothetical protein